jgi:hypothetical protein
VTPLAGIIPGAVKKQPRYKMQTVDFKSIVEFFDYLPEEERVLTEILRDVIFECVPDAREKLSFNVPYYQRNKGIFFIWPAAVLWGTKKSYEGVRLGFQQGFLIDDDENYLDKGNRKVICYHDFIPGEALDIEQLKRYLLKAVKVDDQVAKGKKGRPML